jgi:hypothetical protein
MNLLFFPVDENTAKIAIGYAELFNAGVFAISATIFQFNVSPVNEKFLFPVFNSG